MILVGAEYLLEVLFGFQSSFSDRTCKVHELVDKLGVILFFREVFFVCISHKKKSQHIHVPPERVES